MVYAVFHIPLELRKNSFEILYCLIGLVYHYSGLLTQLDKCGVPSPFNHVKM